MLHGIQTNHYNSTTVLNSNTTLIIYLIVSNTEIVVKGTHNGKLIKYMAEIRYREILSNKNKKAVSNNESSTKKVGPLDAKGRWAP